MGITSVIAIYVSCWLVTGMILINYAVLYKGSLKTKKTLVIAGYVAYGLENTVVAAYLFGSDLTYLYQFTDADIFSDFWMLCLLGSFTVTDVMSLNRRLRRALSGAVIAAAVCVPVAYRISLSDMLCSEPLFNAANSTIKLLWLLTISALIGTYIFYVRKKDLLNAAKARCVALTVVFQFLSDVIQTLNPNDAESHISILIVVVGVSFMVLGFDVNGILDARDEKATLQANLDTAAMIQSSMLPSVFPAFPERQDFEIFASMDPAKDVGGDFYDFFLIDDDHLAFVMADVSGKGIPAAMFMVKSREQIRSNVLHGLSPTQVLSDTNVMLFSENGAMMFVTVWLGILDTRTGELQYANGGHNYPYYYHAAEDRWDMLKEKSGPFLGIRKKSRYKELSPLTMEPGDRILLYTDGVTEAMNTSEEMFGEQRPLDWLTASVSADTVPKAEAEGQDDSGSSSVSEFLVRGLRAEVDRFAGEAEQFDDITMLTVAYRGQDALH